MSAVVLLAVATATQDKECSCDDGSRSDESTNHATGNGGSVGRLGRL